MRRWHELLLSLRAVASGTRLSGAVIRSICRSAKDLRGTQPPEFTVHAVSVSQSVPANLATGRKLFLHMEIGDEALRETCHLVPESATSLREPIPCAGVLPNGSRDHDGKSGRFNRPVDLLE